jgi:hypothetical protein
MDHSDLLGAEPSNATILLIAKAALGLQKPAPACISYFAALESALCDEPPPFGTPEYGDLYREASADPRWMAISLITNAEREGDGATRLWSLSACSAKQEEQRLLKVHAVDESRHARIYLALLDLAFPDVTDPGFRTELSKLSPRYSLRMKTWPVEGSPYAKAPSIDDFVQMNIAEIRTTIHHLMQRAPLAEHSPPATRGQIRMIQDALLRDELNHVAYTAVLIERLSQTLPSDSLRALFRRRFRDFNQITNDELSDHNFDCSVDCCKRHEGCRPRVASPNEFIDAPF